MFQQKVATRPSGPISSVSSTVASRRTRCAHSETVLRCSSVALAVMIDL